MAPTDRESPMSWFCGWCKTRMVDYLDVGYDGPKHKEDQTRCGPVMDWLILCRACAKKHWSAKGD